MPRRNYLTLDLAKISLIKPKNYKLKKSINVFDFIRINFCFSKYTVIV